MIINVATVLLYVRTEEGKRSIVINRVLTNRLHELDADMQQAGESENASVYQP